MRVPVAHFVVQLPQKIARQLLVGGWLLLAAEGEEECLANRVVEKKAPSSERQVSRHRLRHAAGECLEVGRGQQAPDLGVGSRDSLELGNAAPKLGDELGRAENRERILEQLVLGDPHFMRATPGLLRVREMNGEQHFTGALDRSRPVIDDQYRSLGASAAFRECVPWALRGQRAEKVVAVGADAYFHQVEPALRILL